MARSINEIQQQIIAARDADATLSGFSWSTSNVAIWRLWTYITAVCIWTLETLFDSHRNDVETLIALKKPHTLQWYVEKVKLFQYGISLPSGSDNYDSISDDPAISIVKYAAAIELPNIVRLKVASETSGALTALDTVQLDACKAYMSKVKDAGVRLQITSGAADVLRLTVEIYYDPLVQDSTGAMLDGTATSPVKSATSAFLGNLPFNGIFVQDHLAAALQQVKGVKIAHIVNAEANYGATPFVPVGIAYTPDAGYLSLDETHFDANVVFIPSVSI